MTAAVNTSTSGVPASGRLVSLADFTASGSFIVPSGISLLTIYGCGGGGGGGGGFQAVAGGGGGGGQNIISKSFGSLPSIIDI